MSTDIRSRVDDALKTAMKSRDKQRVAALRQITSEFKKVEVDERIEIDDARALQIFDKMAKQRKDSLSQYQSAGREDLAAGEQYELDVISEFMPAALSDDELASLVDAAIEEAGATSMQQMGAVMGILKPKIQGRADMGAASNQVKARLT